MQDTWQYQILVHPPEMDLSDNTDPLTKFSPKNPISTKLLSFPPFPLYSTNHPQKLLYFNDGTLPALLSTMNSLADFSPEALALHLNCPMTLAATQ